MAQVFVTFDDYVSSIKNSSKRRCVCCNKQRLLRSAVITDEAARSFMGTAVLGYNEAMLSQELTADLMNYDCSELTKQFPEAPKWFAEWAMPDGACPYGKTLEISQSRRAVP